MKYVGTFETEVTFGGRYPSRKIEETSALDKALEIYELIDGFTYVELENAINRIKDSKNPNKAHLEILSNVRDYKRIIDGIE